MKAGWIIFFGLIAAMAIAGHFLSGPQQAPPPPQAATPSPPPAAPPITPVQGSGKAKYTPAEEAGLRLAALESRGHLRLAIGQDIAFIDVEPTSWQAMRHRDKENLCRLAQTFIDGLNQQGRNILFIFFRDMTTKAKLAEVSLRDGHTSIYK